MTNQLRITALTATLALIQLFAICRPAIAQPYDAPPRQLSVMTWNVEWMYDDFKGDNRSKLAKEQSAPSREYWNEKLDGVAAAIAESEAHIVALQEIEGRQTLSAIRNLLKEKHGVSYRYAFIEGTDTFTEQDVGLLFRNGLISYRRQEQSKVMYDSRDYYNLSKHLIGEFRWDGVARPLTVLNVHLRATADAEDKRVKQAKLARKFLEEQIRAGEDVIILGDFNSEHMAGTFKGDVAAVVTPERDMLDLMERHSPATVATHVVLDKQFDRIFASRSMTRDTPGKNWNFVGIQVVREPVIRGKQDGQEHWDRRLSDKNFESLDLSDHFPVVATFELR